MPVRRNQPVVDGFNAAAVLPFNLRIADVGSAMQDVYASSSTSPDLQLQGHYPKEAVRAGAHGIEIKTTRDAGTQSTPWRDERNGCASSSMPSQRAAMRPRLRPSTVACKACRVQERIECTSFGG